MAVVGSATAQVGPVAPGTLVVYTSISANVTVSATTEGAANTVVTAATFVANGTDTFWIEFFSGDVQTGATAGSQVNVCLFEAASVLAGLWGLCQNTGASAFGLAYPMTLRFKHTPAAGPRQYIVKAFQAVSNGIVAAGAGGTGAFPNAYIAITKAAN